MDSNERTEGSSEEPELPYECRDCDARPRTGLEAFVHARDTGHTLRLRRARTPEELEE
jgi:hypothetical protein